MAHDKTLAAASLVELLEALLRERGTSCSALGGEGFRVVARQVFKQLQNLNLPFDERFDLVCASTALVDQLPKPESEAPSAEMPIRKKLPDPEFLSLLENFLGSSGWEKFKKSALVSSAA